MASIALAACSGGGSTPPAIAPVRPALAIQEFAAERDAYLVGETATLRVLESRISAAGHTATLATDGSVILIGGYRAGNFWSASIDRFDPGSREFARIGILVAPRQGHRVTRLEDGRLSIAGGENQTTWLLPNVLLYE